MTNIKRLAALSTLFRQDCKLPLKETLNLFQPSEFHLVAVRVVLLALADRRLREGDPNDGGPVKAS